MYVGIDVSHDRGCSVAALDASGRLRGLEWSKPKSGAAVAAHARLVVDAVRALTKSERAVAIGIDAPRRLLVEPRERYWSEGRWRPRMPKEKGLGRHCEVVIKAMNLANPQWTPLATDVPASSWMSLGVKLFEALSALGPVHEVFPSAAYAVLEGAEQPRVDLAFAGFKQGPKDAIDAVMAAVTVREFVEGRGWATPAGDGLGSIVLPRRPDSGLNGSLQTWPNQPRRP